MDQCVAENAREIARYISESESPREDEEATPAVRSDGPTSADGSTSTLQGREGESIHGGL